MVVYYRFYSCILVHLAGLKSMYFFPLKEGIILHPHILPQIFSNFYLRFTSSIKLLRVWIETEGEPMSCLRKCLYFMVISLDAGQSSWWAERYLCTSQ